MATKKKKAKQYSQEFKQHALEVFENRGERSISDVARELGVRSNQLHLWRNRYGTKMKTEETAIAALPRESTDVHELQDQVRQLRQQVATVKRSRDFLKKAVAFFLEEEERGVA